MTSILSEMVDTVEMRVHATQYGPSEHITSVRGAV